jgi:hypothetical protein
MTTTLTPPITGIRTFRGIPEKGMRFLSVNLAMVDVAELMDIAKKLGFKPELVQMPMKDHTQIHALLWHGSIAQTPADLEDRFDELSELIDSRAIRYASGQSPADYLATCQIGAIAHDCNQ